MNIFNHKFFKFVPYLICILFFLAFSTLSVVRHNNFSSFGYDLGIADQAVWKYSNLSIPITSVDPFPDKSIFATHVELIFLLISPAYLIWDTAITLLILEVAFISASGLAIYLLAKKKKISELISIAVLITYLSFYGVQNALWFDVHSITFGAALIAWFLYFFDSKKYLFALLFLILSITSKENIGLITFLISIYYLIKNNDKKWPLAFMLTSAIYVLFIFYIFFPYIIKIDFLYENSSGLLSNLNPLSLIDTNEKIKVIFYSFFSYGFLPLLSPLTLIPILGDFATYFVLGSELPGAQGLFGQYRVLLSPLLAWSTIITISRFKKLNKPFIAILLISTTAVMQYHLHLPLSYLSKGWFWDEPSAVKDINFIIENEVPKNASVVAQNNIIPHISQRDNIFTLYPEKKVFDSQDFCGKNECNWFRWHNEPEFLLVDLSSNWDARHLLTNNEEFIMAIQNLEKNKVIEMYKEKNNTKLYKIKINPRDFP
jgi:uncharacterized membrane protein